LYKIEGVNKLAEAATLLNCGPLRDSLNEINRHVNDVLEEGRRAQQGKPINGHKLADFAYQKLGAFDAYYLGRTDIESWIEKKLSSDQVNQPFLWTTKYNGVTYRLWAQPFSSVINPTIKVNGECISTDKLGHFFRHGHDYYDTHHKQGKDAALSLGHKKEMGTFGVATTGVYSNADISANEDGYRFFCDLEKNPSMEFNLSNYISPKWDEEIESNFYDENVAIHVWNHILNARFEGIIKPYQVLHPSFTFFTLQAHQDKSITGFYSYVGKDKQRKTGQMSGSFSFIKNKEGLVTGVNLKFTWHEYDNLGQAYHGHSLLKSTKENTLDGLFFNHPFFSKIEIQRTSF